MRILVTGANGFIGGYLVSYLLQSGHEVICCVRSVQKTRERFPMANVIACDFNRDIHVEDWLPRLGNIDAVINCAGILAGSRRQNIANIHFHAPVALFKACERLKVRRVIQLSALGIEDGPDIDYVTTKRQADRALRSLNLSSCILRPSLIYASGAYGGSSLLRALAAFPFAIPLVGSGRYRFQPVMMDDLTRVICHFLTSDKQGVINVTGPKTASIRAILIAFRQWLGFGKTRVLPIPDWLIKPIIKLGDILPLGPLNSVSYKMTMQENVANYQALRELIDFDMTPFPEGLNFYPSQTQDRWYARLYFLQPLLTISLFLLWFFSGLNPLLFQPGQAEQLLIQLGVPINMSMPIRVISCLWDIVLSLGIALFSRKNLIGLLQLLTIGGYTLIATFGLTELWTQPLAPLLKNIPVMVAVLIWMAMNDK